MALTLSKTGITTSKTVEASHVTQSIDALTGTTAYSLEISGSLTMIGNTTISSSTFTVTSTSSITGPSTFTHRVGIGQDNIFTGLNSLSQGIENQSLGKYSFSSGYINIAKGNASQAFGSGSIASGSHQLVCGAYNTHGDDTSYLIVGGGTRDVSRLDAFKVTHSSSIVVPTASAEPNWAGQEGEMVPFDAGSNQEYLYVFVKGAWRKVELANA